MLVLGFPDSSGQTESLAAQLGASAEVIELHRFPDGESRVRLPARLPEAVVICRSLDRPNDKLIELMLAAETARTLGAGHLTLVAPYLCYMRQDAAFHSGEAVSQQIIGRYLARLFDTVITVDPHLHRISTLAQAVPTQRAVALSAAPAMGEFLAGRQQQALLVGPDQESLQWVRQAAQVAQLDYLVAEKTRSGDRAVEIRLPERSFAGVTAVLVDDVASTGHTLAAAARELKLQGAERVDVLVTHALFVDDAEDLLRDSGVTEVFSSDSVAHPSNAFALAPMLADAVKEQPDCGTA